MTTVKSARGAGPACFSGEGAGGFIAVPMQKKFLPIEDYLQTDPWDRPVEPVVQARFESWVVAREQQAEADFQALIGISIQEVPEPHFEGFRIVVSKVRRALAASVPPLEVIGRIQALMDDYAADRLILLLEQHNDIFDDVGRLTELRYRAKCWASGDETAFLGQDGALRFKGRINAQAALKRRGTKGPLRRAVERICVDLQATTLDEFLEGLEEDENLVAQLYLMSLIDIIDVQVDYGHGVVRYHIRAQSPASEPKIVGFKRLKNLIADLRHPKGQAHP